jgi:hypothetical protein
MTTTTTPIKGESAVTTVRNAEREPVMLKKRIGSTDFIINVRFSQTSAETLEDKILKLIEREVCVNA